MPEAFQNQFDPAPSEADEPPQRIPKNAQQLLAWIDSVNVAEDLDTSVLAQLGEAVVRDFAADKESRADWEKDYASALKVAKQIKEAKSFPWPNAANVKYPLLAISAIAFAARTLPEIIPPSGNIVGAKVVGQDPQGLKKARAERVADLMNYQLTEQVQGWTEETDLLLHMLPIAAPCWRKLYWDGVERCPGSDVYGPDVVVVHAKERRGDIPRRMTHEITDWTRNDIVERQRSRLWRTVDLGAPDAEDRDSEDVTAGYVFLEQYTWADLDEDGYAEPWVVTVHKDSQTVVRVVARFEAEGVTLDDRGQVVKIQPVKMWQRYGFIPDPAGGFYDIAFGSLLNPLNNTLNGLINQLLDAGTLRNAGGGFIGQAANLRGGAVSVIPGRWQPIQATGSALKDSLVPYPTAEPSPVLFSLLEFLLQGAQQLAAISDQTTGQKTSPNEPATTTLARLQEGLRVFSAIHKRVITALTGEVRELYRLNRLHLDPQDYANILDDPQANKDSDFEGVRADIAPTADPNIAGDVVRQARQQAILQAVAGAGGNIQEAARDVLEAMHVDKGDVDRYFPQGLPPQMQQQVQMLEESFQQAVSQIEAMKQQLADKQQEIAIKWYEAETKRLQAEKPEAAGTDAQADDIDRAKLDLDRQRLDHERQRTEFERDAEMFRMMRELHETENPQPVEAVE